MVELGTGFTMEHLWKQHKSCKRQKNTEKDRKRETRKGKKRNQKGEQKKAKKKKKEKDNWQKTSGGFSGGTLYESEAFLSIMGSQIVKRLRDGLS